MQTFPHNSPFKSSLNLKDQKSGKSALGMERPCADGSSRRPWLGRSDFWALFLKKCHERINNLFLVISIMMLLSCEDFRKWDIEPETESRLVVQAILTDEVSIQEIRLSESFTDLNAEIPAITTAIVHVETPGERILFVADPNDPGLYQSERPFKIFDNLTYNLSILWEDQVYTASSELSNVGPIPEFGFQSHENSDSLSFNAFTQTYNTSQQAMYEMDIDWSHLSNISPTRARQYFYTFNTLYINQLFLPGKEEVLFPEGSIILVKKYGLNEDFAAFLQAMVLETEWSGNFFYATPENVPSNLSNGALGFFSTCAVLRDTLVAR